MSELRVTTSSAEETFRLGRRLGEAAEPGDVFLLEGSFGAGKTVLVQGLAEGLGVEGPVSSPSYVIATRHRGRMPLYHVDLYRLERIEPALLEELEDYMADQAVTAVEWSERLPPEFREGATVIRLEPESEDRRAVRVNTPHERLKRAVTAEEV